MDGESLHDSKARALAQLRQARASKAAEVEGGRVIRLQKRNGNYQVSSGHEQTIKLRHDGLRNGEDDLGDETCRDPHPAARRTISRATPWTFASSWLAHPPPVRLSTRAP